MPYIASHGKIFAFLAGALSVAGFAPVYCLPAAVIAFSLLLYLLLKAPSYKKAFTLGYAFGFAHFSFGLSWIGNALLIEPEKFAWLYPFVLLASGSFFGLFFAFPAFIGHYASRPWQKWLSFSAVMVIFEWLRSFLFTGFPWNLSGYMLAFNDNLIQAASFGGTYLLSLITLAGCSLGGLWLNQRNAKNLAAVACGMLICFGGLWLWGYFRLATADKTLSNTILRLVQPSIPQTLKWSPDTKEGNFQTYLQLSDSPSLPKPQLIIWGETASPFMLDIDDNHRRQAARIIPQDSYLITGMISYRPQNDWYVPHNSMAVINSRGNIVALYHKTHLVPFGEYIPFREHLPDFIRPIANSIGTFGQGNGPEKIALKDLPTFSAAICYEIIFPHQIINQSDRPDFLINLTNDGWYGDSAGPYQHWTVAKLRAVEEGITIVRAANNGISGLITAYGIEQAFLPLNAVGFLDVALPAIPSVQTFYGRTGNFAVITFCLILLFLGSIKVGNELSMIRTKK